MNAKFVTQSIGDGTIASSSRVVFCGTGSNQNFAGWVAARSKILLQKILIAFIAILAIGMQIMGQVYAQGTDTPETTPVASSNLPEISLKEASLPIRTVIEGEIIDFRLVADRHRDEQNSCQCSMDPKRVTFYLVIHLNNLQ